MADPCGGRGERLRPETDAVAKAACRLAEIDHRRFHFLIQQHPHFATHVMKTLADRLRHMNAVTAAREEMPTNS